MTGLHTHITRVPRPLFAIFTAVAAFLLSSSSAPLSKPILLQSGEVWPATKLSKTPNVAGAGRSVVIFLKGTVRGAHIRSVNIESPYRAVSVAKDAVVSDLVIDGLQARVLRECIRLHGDRLTIKNVRCAMVPPPKTSMHELPEGIVVYGGSDIRIEHSRFSGFQMIMGSSRYWNGDGVAIEKGVSGLVIRDVASDDNTDAGFDIKPPVKMDNVRASGNCRNFRFWSNADVGTIRVGDVVQRGGTSHCAGIWVKGSEAGPHRRIRIRNLVVSASRRLDIITVEKGSADIEIDHCTIRAPRGTKLIGVTNRGGQLKVDRSCHVN